MARVAGCLAMVAAGVFASPKAGAAVIRLGAALDYYNYSNARFSSPGSVPSVPVFATLHTAEEDRLGQMLLGFNTSLSVPTGRGAANYQISSIRLTLTNVNDEAFAYDPSYDSYRTYLPASDPLHQSDADSGRPIEVHGVGFRNGYTRLSFSLSGNATPGFSENSPYGPTGLHQRNVFARSFGTPRADGDVSDSVGEAFETTPFAIGITDEVAPGRLVPSDTEFRFEMNLTDLSIRGYFQQALNDGALGLMVASLHASTQDGAQTYPRFYTREGALPELRPSIEITYQIIPEPSGSLLLVIATGIIAAGRAWHRRDSLS